MLRNPLGQMILNLLTTMRAFFSYHMCFSLLSLALVLSNQDDRDTTFEITTTGDSTITVTCSHNQAPHHCATRVCDEFELSDTVEGVGCVEMLSDEISARRENSGDNGGGFCLR